MNERLPGSSSTIQAPLIRENTAPDSSCQANSSFSIKHHERKTSFRVYPHCVEYTAIPKPTKIFRYKKSKRGRITEFTRRSRFRLLQILAKVRTDISFKPLFFSMTYHHNFSLPNKSYVHNLHSFLSSLRSLDKEVEYLWRLEFQRRGAPHFHFIVFPGPSVKKLGTEKYMLLCADIWHRISDPDSKSHELYGFKSTVINSYSKAVAYVSKYVAKVDDLPVRVEGCKHYGNSRNLPLAKPLLIEMSEHEASSVIFRIANFLKQTGKSYKSNSLFFNQDFDQFIFIDQKDFLGMIDSQFNFSSPP